MLEVYMNKFLSILIVFLGVAMPTFAYITTDEALSEKYIQTHGYSSEISHLMDLQNAQINPSDNEKIN